MLRSLIIIAALILVFLLIKNRLQGHNTSKSKASSTHSEDTVQCIECKTYVPRIEAIASDDRTFCCKQHQHDWHARQ